jgi:hypothetical protein
VSGFFYSNESSKRHAASINYSEDGNIHCQERDYPVDTLLFSNRIGNTARFIDFPDQGKFETPDNESIDKLIKLAEIQGHIQTSTFGRWAHKLESSSKFIACTLVMVALFCWSFIEYGLPYFSQEIAMRLPVNIATELGQGSLDILDNSVMEESELSETRKAELTAIFEQLKPKVLSTEHQNSKALSETDGQIPLQLVFRKSEAIGANAFALPSGTILFTDEMIALAAHDDELKTIMLHEIGHVVHRHSLQQLIQQSSLAILVVLVTGDLSTTSSILLAAPSLLLEAKFSQSMEQAADSFALEHLSTYGLSGQHFVNIMQRVEESHRAKADNSTENQLLDYFSSHPSTEERLKRFQSTSEKTKF